MERFKDYLYQFVRNKESLKKIAVKIEKIDLNRKKVTKSFSIVPFGFSMALANLNRKKVKNLLLIKLSSYPNLKRFVIKILLHLSLLKKIDMEVPEGIDLVLVSNRIKLFDFNKSFVFTITDKKNIAKERRISKILGDSINYKKNVKFLNNYKKEDLLSPYEKIGFKDILNAFSQMVIVYNKTLKKKNFKEYCNLLQKAYGYSPDSTDLNNLIKKIPYYSVLAHGDFCELNLIKHGGKNYILDWEDSKEGVIMEDFIRFFVSDYSHIGIIDRKKFYLIRSIFMKNFKISKKEFADMVHLYLKILSNSKKDWNSEKFENLIKKLL